MFTDKQGLMHILYTLRKYTSSSSQTTADDRPIRASSMRATTALCHWCSYCRTPLILRASHRMPRHKCPAIQPNSPTHHESSAFRLRAPQSEVESTPTEKNNSHYKQQDSIATLHNAPPFVQQLTNKTTPSLNPALLQPWISSTGALEGRLLFAVPKSTYARPNAIPKAEKPQLTSSFYLEGRLNSATLNLLEGADIQFRRENRLDIALVKNLPIALIFLPAADIPTFVGEGRVDLGITGWDQVQEHDAAVKAHNRSRRSSVDAASETKEGGCDTVMELGFGGCRLQVQVPEKGKYITAQDLVGRTIGTSFVNLAAQYFAKLEYGEDSEESASPRKLRTKIVELSGSVEAACALGVAEGIVDLVESGETMRAAGLKAIDTVVDSTAVLIKSKSPSNPEMVELIASRIRGVITAQRYVLCQYNIERSQLSKATKITPGKRAATITTLDTEGWVAVSSMVEKKKIALVMDDLTRVGAHDILVLDIHNTRE
ncbi:hypothetical protein G7046_g4567 [Stylonectria norvegica]|nr:hypothetical protein G7046_g4567 [Stylonectria norvegica]